MEHNWIAPMEETSTPAVTPEMGLAFLEQQGWTQDNMPEEMAMLLRLAVLNELFSGSWKQEKDGVEQLKKRLGKLDMKKLFHGYHVNPLASGLLSELFSEEPNTETVPVPPELPEAGENALAP